MTTRLTKNAKIVLWYYLNLGKERFRLSLDTITTATGVKKRTVRRANDQLRDLGVISWIRGHGDLRAGGTACTPNEYQIAPEAIRAHKRNRGRTQAALRRGTATETVTGGSVS
jgi:hypothetical protein